MLPSKACFLLLLALSSSSTNGTNGVQAQEHQQQHQQRAIQAIVENAIDYIFLVEPSTEGSTFNLPKHLQATYQRGSGRKCSVDQHATMTANTLSDHVKVLQNNNVFLDDSSPYYSWMVVQEDDDIPALPSSLRTDSVLAAQTLYKYADGAGTRTMFVMPWGRRYGFEANGVAYPDFLSHTEALLEGMNAYLHATTMAFLAPVGLVFATIYNDCVAQNIDPQSSDCLFSKLYTFYGNQPSMRGTYLIGLTIATAMTGYDPMRQTWLPDIDGYDFDPDEAWQIRDAVGKTILQTFQSGEVEYPWYEAWPTKAPTGSPSAQPSGIPSATPTNSPTQSPTTATPSQRPTISTAPSDSPSDTPSMIPSDSPSSVPSSSPSSSPSASPSDEPSGVPTQSPTVSAAPSSTPSAAPSGAPSANPSVAPTRTPSYSPSGSPTNEPSSIPTQSPTKSAMPSLTPTLFPSAMPSSYPSAAPTMAPSSSPSVSPTDEPSGSPTDAPSNLPSLSPTERPSLLPSVSPTLAPTHSAQPSPMPTLYPSLTPTISTEPTFHPSATPFTRSPSVIMNEAGANTAAAPNNSEGRTAVAISEEQSSGTTVILSTCYWGILVLACYFM